MKHEPELQEKINQEIDRAMFETMPKGGQSAIVELIADGATPEEIRERAFQSITRQYPAMPLHKKEDHANKWWHAARHAVRIKSN